jgi:hypothetical protein
MTWLMDGSYSWEVVKIIQDEGTDIGYERLLTPYERWRKTFLDWIYFHKPSKSSRIIIT